MLSLLALFIAAFASDSGSQDPQGARVSERIIWMPVVFLFCALVSVFLAGTERVKLAFVMAIVPILYFVFALAFNG